MNVSLNIKNFSQLTVKKKAFSSIAFTQENTIAFDKYRFQTMGTPLQSLYAQTISFAISSNGNFCAIITNKFYVYIIDMNCNTIVSECLLPESTMKIVKECTNSEKIGFFTSHTKKYSYLQENDLKLFVDWQGKNIGIITGKLL